MVQKGTFTTSLHLLIRKAESYWRGVVERKSFGQKHNFRLKAQIQRGKNSTDLHESCLANIDIYGTKRRYPCLLGPRVRLGETDTTSTRLCLPFSFFKRQRDIVSSLQYLNNLQHFINCISLSIFLRGTLLFLFVSIIPLLCDLPKKN